MLSNGTLDSIGADQDAGVVDVAIREVKYDLFWVLFDFGQTLAKSDVLDRYEASHDV